MIGQFIVKCLHAATAAHVLHLTTRSYAQHVALGDFYTTLPGLVDRLAESYMGVHGAPQVLHAGYAKPSDAEAVVAELADYIEENRGRLVDKSETCLLNILDEIQALCAQTLYKLRFLK